MDNHAGNLNIEDLKWLGGLLDSDGCIGISKSVRKHNNVVYTPSITFTNSNSLIINKCIEILSHHAINNHVKANGTCINITISRPNIILKFYSVMEKYIITKSTELNFIKDFCLLRVNNVQRSGCNWKANYTMEETRIVNDLSELNKNHYGECLEYGISDMLPNVDSLNKFSLSWLAGFIDGDGCITINKLKRPNGTFQYQPMVHIVTGSPLSKAVIGIFLDRYNINYYLKKSLSGTKHRANCVNKRFEFYIRSHEDCVNILKILGSKLYGKKLRGEKLIDFCISRNSNKNKPYSEIELGLYDAIKQDMRDSSTTTRKTLISEDIV